MEFDHEALQLLQETAVKAAAVEKIDCANPRKLLLKHGEQLVEKDVPPPVRSHACATLVDLISYAGDLAELKLAARAVVEEEAEQSTETGIVFWHGPAAVVLMLDDADRRDRVTFALAQSIQYATLVNLEKNRGGGMTQKEFIRMMRIDLGHEDAAFLDAFRRLEWRAGAEAVITTGKTRESLGKTVMSEVTAGAQAIPEEVLLNVPVYRNPGEQETQTVRCLIEVDAQAQRIGLMPATGELDNAMARAQGAIRQRIVDGIHDYNIKVYYGSP